MGDKGNDRVKFPSIRALLNVRRDKINEEAYPIEKTAVVSEIPSEGWDSSIMKRELQAYRHTRTCLLSTESVGGVQKPPLVDFQWLNSNIYKS